MDTGGIEKKYSELDISFQKIEKLEWEDCSFENIKGSESHLYGCLFVDCVFKNCDFSNARFTVSRFNGCTFEGCKLVGVNWGDAASLAILKFEGCNLSYSSFSNIKLPRGQFLNCAMIETNLSESEFANGSFAFSDLSGANFAASDLRSVDFREARNIAIDIRSVKIAKAKFLPDEAIGLLDIFNIDIEK